MDLRVPSGRKRTLLSSPIKRSSAGLSPNEPGASYVCALCPLGNSLFCRHGKNSAATPLAGTGLREASLGKNDNGCLFIVTEMCGASDMKQRRPLAAAEAAAAGTWFQNLSRRFWPSSRRL